MIPHEIYQYLGAILKHLPEKSPKTIRNLFGKRIKKVSYNGNIHRRLNNSNTAAYITNDYIDDRIAKVATVIKNEKVYRICLRYLCSLGKINLSCKNKL